MRRIASHSIYWKQLYRMHYIELDNQNVLLGIYPLSEEIERTEFYDGILLLALTSEPDHTDSLREFLHEYTRQQYDFREWISCLTIGRDVRIGDVVTVYHLSGFPLASPELRTYYSGGSGYVKRL